MRSLRRRLRIISVTVAFLFLISACSVSIDTAQLEAMSGAQATSVETDSAQSDSAQSEPPQAESALEPAASPQTEVDEETGMRSSAPAEDPQNRELPEPTPTPPPPPTPSQEPTNDENPFADPINGGGIDFRLTRDDVDCDADDLNAYVDTLFVVAHVVVDGNLGAACFGSSDPRLIESWQILAAITPPGQLHDLALFGGYVSTEKGETTLAFVNALDFEGSAFQMSINLDEAEADPDELRLTMAHEFSHVFTSLPSELDRFTFPEDCTTWDNGEGCFEEDSLMWEWIQIFWANGLIDEIDARTDPTSSGGQARCDVNDGFLGPYSASSPEEDFAESFSAFVFQLDVPSERLRTKMAWFAGQPGLVEFRDLAIASGYGPQTNYFPRCG